MSPAKAVDAVTEEELAAIAGGRHPEPHSILGQHARGSGWVIRARRPLAASVTAIRANGTRIPLRHVSSGIWQGTARGRGQPYVLETTYESGPDWIADDPYRFVPSIGEVDLYLFGEGRHEKLWDALGAHARQHEGVDGTSFTVWAPHARAARVVGDFNNWDGTGSAMRRLDDNGVWELFLPDVRPGAAYKFELLTAAGNWVLRADPMARHSEIPPATASRVTASGYEWADSDWMSDRAGRDPLTNPMSVFEVHAGSWRPGLGYRDLATELVDYVRELGYTHVEFLPLAEHPFGGSWGYQVTGYYAPTSRFGDPDDLRYLIDRLHAAGIGVIMDWVPAHFPKDEWALARFDGETLYEHGDPQRGEQHDWGTLIFDFGRSQVRNFLVANALYWFDEFHVDGLRVDAVASMLYLDYSKNAGEWTPNKFGGRENLEAIDLLKEVNATVYKHHPGIVMIAEESTAFAGVTAPTSADGLGFGLKWNMGWMHDTLQFMAVDPLYRSHHHGELTFSLVYAFSENFLLPISHDEVVHGKGSLLQKMPGDQWQKLANVRAYLAYQWAHPGKQLLFMGQEFGQPSEWSEERGLDWWILDQPVHRGLLTLVSRLNRTYRETPALWQLDHESRGFQWIIGDDSRNNVIAFLRWTFDGDPIAVVINFSGNPVGPYRIGLPRFGEWVELLNTDAIEFGGSGVGNLGSITADGPPHNGQPNSAEITLPPLAALWLAPARL
ncbi:MAG: 1,4-alpha-glucan branching protein GlgB [Cryobacterium sp.]|nr:1,4-alpha-glucan branching protein GlgB [Cryobacterium sp.]